MRYIVLEILTSILKFISMTLYYHHIEISSLFSMAVLIIGANKALIRDPGFVTDFCLWTKNFLSKAWFERLKLDQITETIWLLP